MKSTIINTVLLLGIAEINAQSVPMRSTIRQAEQQHLQQQNAAIIQKHNTGNQSRQQHVQEIQAELRQGEAHNKTINYAFPENKELAAQSFKQSFLELQNMLADNHDLSLKRAVFLSENAFLDNSMRYDGFCNDIAMELDILKAFMQKEKLDWGSDIAKKYMLQKFFSDTLTLKDDKGNYQLTHYPYRYDFADPFGQNDWNKMFVTKLLRDKKGQCHSMPLLYLIFAEELGVKAWLAYSPQHSYIKTQDDKENWYNFETTNGHYSTDSWILSSGYVKTEAMRNKIFMDTLSKKQTVAACMLDLANAYTRKFGFDGFVLECVDKVLAYSPKNIFALQLKADYYTYLFQYVAKQLGYPPKEQMPQYPEAYRLMQKVFEQYQRVDETGYEDMPEDMYQIWLKSFENEKIKHTEKVIKP